MNPGAFFLIDFVHQSLDICQRIGIQCGFDGNGSFQKLNVFGVRESFLDFSDNCRCPGAVFNNPHSSVLEVAVNEA